MGIYHDPAKGEKPFVLPCSIFGGRSPKTGKRVGERHRWSRFGQCDFCGRYKEDVLSKPVPREKTLSEIIESGN